MHVQRLFDLKGKIALVTGGAGLFGRQIAEALAESGATTFMASRNVDKLNAQAEKFKTAGLTVNVESLDQSDESSIEALKSRILRDHHRIDVAFTCPTTSGIEMNRPSSSLAWAATHMEALRTPSCNVACEVSRRWITSRKFLTSAGSPP